MKNGSYFFRLLLVICIVLIHIHMSLYTIGNMTNPVTFVMMYLRSDTDFIWIFTVLCATYSNSFGRLFNFGLEAALVLVFNSNFGVVYRTLCT